MTPTPEPPDAPSGRIARAVRPETREARRRILDAGIRSIIAHGVEGSTMAVIAAAAGVSKALVHYHFADRATLFADIAMRLGRRIVAREASATTSAMPSATGAHVVDALRAWLQDELERGEICALLALGMVREPRVLEACQRAREFRHQATTGVVTRTFERLGLTPRLPAALIADTAIALTDGLALQGGVEAQQAAFDGFWLAMLNLAES